MNEKPITSQSVIAKSAIAHTVSYFLMGLLASNIFHYSTMLADPSVSYMRPMTDPLVRSAILFQVLRGVLFGFVFYLLRESVFRPKNGWLILWATLVVLGIISTFAPAPSSIEGFVYTTFLSSHRWGGLLEILIQSFLLATVTFYWVTHPQARWLNWLLGALFVIVLAIGVLAVLASGISR